MKRWEVDEGQRERCRSTPVKPGTLSEADMLLKFDSISFCSIPQRLMDRASTRAISVGACEIRSLDL